jgi:hypothetical protein
MQPIKQLAKLLDKSTSKSTFTPTTWNPSNKNQIFKDLNSKLEEGFDLEMTIKDKYIIKDDTWFYILYKMLQLGTFITPICVQVH